MEGKIITSPRFERLPLQKRIFDIAISLESRSTIYHLEATGARAHTHTHTHKQCSKGGAVLYSVVKLRKSFVGKKGGVWSIFMLQLYF